jgi:hypothetical protein
MQKARCTLNEKFLHLLYTEMATCKHRPKMTGSLAHSRGLRELHISQLVTWKRDVQKEMTSPIRTRVKAVE